MIWPPISCINASKFLATADVLAIERLKQIHERLPNTHLVMHGASSVSQESLATIRQYVGEQPSAYDPRQYFKVATTAAQEVAQSRFEAFGSAGHASKIRPVPMDKMANSYLIRDLAKAV